MTRPIVNIDALELRSQQRGAQYAAQLGRVGAVIGTKLLGAQYIVVPPGKTAYPRHNHRNNEELYFVVEGTGLYRFGDESYPVRAGDLLSAPAGGQETAHQLINTSDAELRYLVFSTRNDPDVFEYPDNGKFGVAAGVPAGKGLMSADLVFIGRKDSAVDYWDGEPGSE